MALIRRSLTTCAAALALPLALAAQSTAPASPVIPRFSIATNPVAIPFGLFSFEYEAALRTPGVTLGVGGSYWGRSHERDSWAEAKAMYYPQETPFRGFAIGLTAGVHSSSRRDSYCVYLDASSNACSNTRRSQTAPTLGVLASYDWLLGRTERFRVGIGAGAKRILRDVSSSSPIDLQTWPDGRFVIGFVF